MIISGMEMEKASTTRTKEMYQQKGENPFGFSPLSNHKLPSSLQT
jgi:hypothetical protein